MKNKKKETGIWLFNISKMNVSLRDLNLTIKAGTHVNLLGRGYSLTRDQILNSIQQGSVFLKRDRLKWSFVQPDFGDQKKVIPVFEGCQRGSPPNLITLDEETLPELELKDADIIIEDE